jgi:membrane associated rhomboid family serine protease
MAARDLMVICGECGSEVSPYVTECPYCGNRLRKRAPDLKKQRKLEEREERRAEKRQERLRAQYESPSPGAGAWIGPVDSRPVATVTLVVIATVASLLAASGLSRISPWMSENLLVLGGLAGHPWTIMTAPFLQYWFGYGFVCLGVFALFGSGLERRYGAVAPILVWIVCGALGVAAEVMIATVPLSYGAYAVAVGTFLAWTIVVVRTEDLRDHDTLGIAAVAFVLCALPLATTAAGVWSLLGGIVGGVLCGTALSHAPGRAR